ncbi:N-methyl-L-tryptophan oxidase [Algoriphagus jejuensis]|uniref:N-methyl-L-tryptophan oxidase n=1 Tax=Algoriphagus jejuensis TaxID=419934 RepID=A0ABN1N0S3_9BACT
MAFLPKYDVAVIGLGALGSAALFQLSKSGKSALGIDRFEPPHTMGSSHGESRITRLAVGEGEDYVALAKRSHEIWKEIEAETGAPIMTTTTGILLDSGIHSWEKHGTVNFWDQTVAFAQRQQINHQILDPAALKARFPAFQLEPAGKVYLEHDAGFVRPELAIQTQLNLARKNGAEIQVDTPVDELSRLGDAVLIRTKKGEFLADRVLLSAGGWVKDFLPAEEKQRLKICRQVLHWLEIDPGFTDWAGYPVWMWGFGSNPTDFIYGFPSLDGRTVKIATESFVDSVHPDLVQRKVSTEEQQRFWEQKVAGRILGLKRNFVRSEVCFYTVTADARFVVKPMGGMEKVLLVSACSGHGFKHSAALGERLALDLLRDT